MATDPRLERYLANLERALKPLPVSERAEIVTEIKSHVLSALERDTQKGLDSVLADIGEPETVANRYLMERGHRTVKPPVSPIVKWLVIGFLGTIALFMLFAALLFSHFSPILSINEKDDQLRILGGLIDIDGKKGTLRIGGTEMHGLTDESESFDGSRMLPSATNLVRVKFTNGKVEFHTQDQRIFDWECRATRGEKKKVEISQQNDDFNLDLSQIKGVKCEIRVPKDLHLSVEGKNGKLLFFGPRYHLDAKLDNGAVGIAPAADTAYRYILDVERGAKDEFRSSEKQGAYELKVSLSNGKIFREGGEEE